MQAYSTEYPNDQIMGTNSFSRVTKFVSALFDEAIKLCRVALLCLLY